MPLFRSRSFFLVLLAGASVARADFDLFPDGPLNPRIPCIAPQKDPVAGSALPFGTDFSYRLAPGVCFTDSGELSFLLRDDLARAEKRLLQLSDRKLTVRVLVTSASAGRLLQAQLLESERIVATVPLKRPADGWSRLELTWDQKTLTLRQENTQAGQVALPQPFRPALLAVRSGKVASLQLKGAGELRLDWTGGYAAKVVPGGADAISLRAFGFDARVISLDRNRRDCPYLQATSAGNTQGAIRVHFSLKGEVGGVDTQWESSLTVPPRGETMQPIALPPDLPSDVYHLSISCDQARFSEQRHFLYVQRRGEAAGPSKFGLHDSGAKQFGYWPDALPVDVAHVYESWGYIQGPPGVKDFNGDWGIDANLPPEEWNWNPRLDWMILEGRRPYVCLISTPFQDWQRRQRYDPSRMVKYGWGWRGGAPDDVKYRRFLHAFFARYQGKLWGCEIENEPNTPHGYDPADYVQIARDVYEEAKASDPRLPVFGVCGTSTFVDWMRQGFAAGGAQYMDGVSWHTYVSPSTPEEADLAGLLASAKKSIAATRPSLAVLNSETGTYVAARETVDAPITEARLASLIEEGVQPLAVPKGWPSRALSEREGASSMVANAVTNFLAGAQCFTFFGWNLDWPKTAKWWNAAFDDSNFGMFSASRDGERTPSQFTLAAGVLMAQLEPAEHQRGREVRSYSLRGGIFPKTSGGEVAVLWTTSGRQTVRLGTDQPQIETVDLLGQVAVRTAKGEADKQVAIVEAGTAPIYVHSRGRLAVLPSIVQSVAAQPSPQGTRLNLTLKNVFAAEWASAIAPLASSPWQDLPREQQLRLAPGGATTLTLAVQPTAGTRPGRYPLVLSFRDPAGEAGVMSVQVPVAATFTIPRLPAGVALSDMRQWDVPALTLDRPEQVVVGRPPSMVSLQEKQYWGGAAELSGKVKVGADAQGLSIYVEVQDANAAAPAKWPGVGGSCVELFLDLRPQGQAGLSRYGEHVHQLVIRPVIKDGQTIAVWHAAGGPDVSARGQQVEGGRIDATHYWVGLRLPWSAAGLRSPPSAIGMDVALDGAKEGGDGRKSQMMLFGTASNNRDASRFGLGFLPFR